MIDVIKATEIMRKYCPETKLEIKNGADGLYLTESDIIWIGRDWHLGGLLHEITHAMLYKEDGRTGHDGVFADRLTRLVGEVFCDHISQQEKKVSLTEQWKNGELEEGAYYVKLESGKIDIYFMVYDDDCDEIVEILAPVPSYEEWQKYVEANESMFRVVKMLNKDNYQLEKDINKLKELLKECSPYVVRSATSRMIKNSVGHKKDMKLLTKIDEVLK